MKEKKKKRQSVCPCFEQHFIANNYWFMHGQDIGIISSQKTSYNYNVVNNNWIEEKKGETERTEQSRYERVRIK